LCRSLPFYPVAAPWIVAVVFSVALASLATSLWIPVMGYFGAVPTGSIDPVFGRDLSFYLLKLPLYQELVGGLIAILIFTLAIWAVAILLFAPTQAQPSRITKAGASGSLFYLLEGAKRNVGNSSMSSVVMNRRAIALAALLCLALALNQLLDRYELVVAGHSKVLAGASYGDIHFWIPAYNVTIAAWLALAVLLAANAIIPGLETWFRSQPVRLLLPSGLFVLVYFGAYAVPAALEEIYVGPNQITLEQPYLARGIAGTRQAFNLDAPPLDEREFAVSAEPLAATDLKRNAATLRDARIWDWRALEPQLQQIQGLRPYYRFSGVDIDRYTIDGIERQVMITARELDVDRLPEQAKVWVTCGRRPGKNFLTFLQHWSGAVTCPACWCGRCGRWP